MRVRLDKQTKYLALNMKNCNITLRLVALAFSVLSTCTATFAAGPTAGDRDRIVVLMSIDGLANFYMDDAAAQMPTIRQLAREGARAAGMKASDPTVTWPNHTTLVTGVAPARHGVMGNSFFDRLKGERITLIWDPYYDKDQAVRMPTIYDMAKAAGLKTAAVHWPATRNARSLDWTSPDVMKVELVAKHTTPSLLQECKAAGLDLLTGDDGKPRPRNESTAEDEFWTRVFNFILQKHRPNLALFHVLSVDQTQHVEGPRSPAAYEALQAADGQVRQVWDVLERDFPGQATLIVVSDHGFSPNRANISLGSVLKKAGLVEMTGKRITGGDVQFAVQGGSALVYVVDEANRESIMSRFKAAFESIDGVAKIVMPDELPDYGMGDPRRDPQAPDMILFAEMGYYFGEAPAAGKKALKGSHGYDSHLPDMQSIFVACGAGIKPGTKLGQIENTAVAPTIAKLLGLELPGTEDRALAEALSE
jgi:predicted AlkP superfamily pyrophosphatase or phosphodiesterase